MGESSSPSKVKYSEDFYTSLKPGQLPRETSPRPENVNVTEEGGEKSEPVTADTVREDIPVMLDPSSDPSAKIERSLSATSKKIFYIIFNSAPITEDNLDLANLRLANIFNHAEKVKVVVSSNVSEPEKNKSDCLNDYLLDVGEKKHGKIMLSLRCKGKVVEEGAVDLKRIDSFESQVGTKLQHVQDAADLQTTDSSFESQLGTKLQRVRGIQNLQGSVVLIPANYGGGLLIIWIILLMLVELYLTS